MIKKRLKGKGRADGYPGRSQQEISCSSHRIGLPSLRYRTSGSSPGFGLYLSAMIPAGKNNANGNIPYQLVPISTITETIIRNIPTGLSCVGFITNTSALILQFQELSLQVTAMTAYDIFWRFCIAVSSVANSVTNGSKLLANIQNPTAIRIPNMEPIKVKV